MNSAIPSSFSRQAWERNAPAYQALRTLPFTRQSAAAGPHRAVRHNKKQMATVSNDRTGALPLRSHPQVIATADATMVAKTLDLHPTRAMVFVVSTTTFVPVEVLA